MLPLNTLRSQISDLDSELLRILDERMELALAIAAYKREYGLPIFDPNREGEILAKIPQIYQTIWREIMNTSKEVQEKSLLNYK